MSKDRVCAVVVIVVRVRQDEDVNNRAVVGAIAELRQKHVRRVGGVRPAVDDQTAALEHAVTLCAVVVSANPDVVPLADIAEVDFEKGV